MKRTVFAFCMCLCSVWTVAQSTCETRVDAHPRATTKQRVNYCLTSPDETTNNNPGLVFSGVTARHPVAQETESKSTAREGNFEQDKVFVERTFVNTQQFPQLKNNTLSEREIWEANKLAAQARQPVETQMETVSIVTVKETKAGLKARKTKPGRHFPEVFIASESVTDLSKPVSQEVAAETVVETNSDTVQPYEPAMPQAPEYVPAEQTAQEYEPAEQTTQPYAPAGQEEIPVGTSSYTPAN